MESGEYDDEGSGSSEENKDKEDVMFNAIVASLIDYTGNDGNPPGVDKKQEEDESRQIKEVIALSKLEDDKKTGKLNLDFLKRGNKNSPRSKAKKPAAQASNI